MTVDVEDGSQSGASDVRFAIDRGQKCGGNRAPEGVEARLWGGDQGSRLDILIWNSSVAP